MAPILAQQRRTSARRRAREQAATCVVGYLRCSTDERAEGGLGLDAQRAAVEAACAAKGWTVTDWAVDEGVSGSVAPADCPAMARALRLLDSGEAGALVAAEVDCIARDLHDLTGLLHRADLDDWAVVAVDLGVDTTTPVGRMLVGILGSVADWERAGVANERADGSGYHRGIGSTEPAAALLASADVYDATTPERPWRAALDIDAAAEQIQEMCAEGILHAECATAVPSQTGSGEPAVAPVYPAGLTHREVDVLRLLATGMTTKVIAASLGISAKTADHHIQSIYNKTGARGRAPATLFALEHGLTQAEPPPRS